MQRVVPENKKESERNSVCGRERNSVHESERINIAHGLERNEQWYCTVGELFRSWVWGGCERIIVIFQNIFGVPSCTTKYLFVVTSSVRGEICVRWVKTPDACTLTVVRLLVEFFLSIPPLHHTQTVTVVKVEKKNQFCTVVPGLKSLSPKLYLSKFNICS